MAKLKFKRKQASTKKTFKRKEKEHKCTKTFNRKYQPRCYSCHKVLQILIDLKWHKDNDMVYSNSYHTLLKRVNDQVIKIVGGGMTRYRHNRSDCEPGGKDYMADEKLAEGFINNHGIEGDCGGGEEESDAEES